MYYIHDFKAKIDMVFMQVTPQLLDEMWGNWHPNVKSVEPARGLILQNKTSFYVDYVCQILSNKFNCLYFTIFCSIFWTYTYWIIYYNKTNIAHNVL
jgi:hypothetical protein